MQGDEVKDMLVSRPESCHEEQESNGVALLHSNDALNCLVSFYALKRGSTTFISAWTKYEVYLALSTQCKSLERDMVVH